MPINVYGTFIDAVQRENGSSEMLFTVHLNQ